MKSNVMCLTWVSEVGEMPVISYGALFGELNRSYVVMVFITERRDFSWYNALVNTPKNFLYLFNFICDEILLKTFLVGRP